VAQHLAGPNWGTVFTPRAGSEVLVDFIDGDIDRPIVIGQLHHGRHDLPWPAGVDAGANHPGTVSGWHSSHLDGGGANQWVIDDANISGPFDTEWGYFDDFAVEALPDRIGLPSPMDQTPTVR
jgi:uncharacterized protein involved in type VI secretion and phage assembly